MIFLEVLESLIVFLEMHLVVGLVLEPVALARSDFGGPVSIVRLTSDEGPRLRAIRLRALRDAPEAFASTAEETAARPPESWTEQLETLPTFVAVDAGNDVGMVRGALDPDDGDLVWLLSMWVDPAARGAGWGTALIEALVEWAGSTGRPRLALDVGDENAPAIALYARTGFTPTGERGSLPPPREHITEHRRERDLRAPSDPRCTPRGSGFERRPGWAPAGPWRGHRPSESRAEARFPATVRARVDIGHIDPTPLPDGPAGPLRQRPHPNGVPLRRVLLGYRRGQEGRLLTATVQQQTRARHVAGQR